MAAAAALTACSSDENPLLVSKFDTPHELPPFEQIEYRHYVPAFEDGIRKAEQAVELICQNRAEATFENTIVPLDRSGEELKRVSAIFFNLMETDVADTMNVIAETILPKLSAFDDELYFNDRLFERIKAVYDNRETAGLDSVQQRVVSLYYKDFIRNGALLTADKKSRLKEINQQLSLLTHTFGTNLLAETNNSYVLVIDSAADLSGLPENVVAAAAEKASEMGKKGKWVFTLHKASMIPFITYSDNHAMRKAIYDAYCLRGCRGGENDNRNVIKQIVALRIEKAKMLGYKTFAHYAIERNMAATPEAVDTFLQMVWAPALAKAKDELVELKKFAYKYDKTTTVEACDWWYWTEKLRKAQYDVQETELSEYFELNSVRNTMFGCATRLYGVKFERLNNVPLYNAEDNEVWSVTDTDGSCLGVVYFDWHPRASKGAGAWCTTFREPIDNFDGTHTEAQVSISCNFTKGANGQPDLLTYDEYLTMFHEFGHALQCLFTKGQYVRTAGNVPGDYVEMPSQINERWASSDSILFKARHYKTGEPIPAELVAKLRRCDNFNQGFNSTEYLAAALLDLQWHKLTDANNIPDVVEFEKKVLGQLGLIDEIEPRYHSTYFSHIFNGGYAAGYYDYEWSEMLVSDAFDAFCECGDIFCKAMSDSFRKNCLGEVGDGDLMQQYIKFRGQKPETWHLMKQRGFLKESKSASKKEGTKSGSASASKSSASKVAKPKTESAQE